MFKALVGITLLAAVIVAFLATSTKANPPEMGAAAPTPAAVDQDGKAFSLEETYKKGITLVYFYPKADTPGCTKEACGLRDNWDAVKAAGIQVVGVSMDKPDAQKDFIDKYKLPFPLLADAEGEIVKAFGVPMIRMGFSKRQSFLVKDGKVVWHDANVDPATHVTTVLEAVKALSAAK